MLAVTDIRIPEKCRAALCAHGFSVISLPPFSALDPRVASHPDMLMLPLGDRLLVHRQYYKEAKTEIDQIVARSSLSLVLTDDEVGTEYPRDVFLNLAVVGTSIIGRKESMSQSAIRYASEKHLRIVNVNQGYAKCSTVVLGDKALITADPTIEKAGIALSLDVLRISEGSVSLDGYDHGFIGGASGVYNNTLFFCGNVMTHPDGKAIVDFCHGHRFDCVFLSDEPLVDAGTIFFF